MQLSKKWALLLAAANFAVGAGMLALWWILYWRDSAPVVLRDELLFSFLATRAPEFSPYSNTAFSAVYSLAGQCDENFLACGRLINFAFWIIVVTVISIFIYLARNWGTAGVGIWASTSAVSMFNVAFLPEVMYYSLITLYLASLAVDLSSRNRQTVLGVLSGLILGVALLVKPHAIFLALSAFLGVSIVNLITRGSLRRVVRLSLGTLIVGALTRVLIETAVGRRNPFDFFGAYLGGGDKAPSFENQLPIQLPMADASQGPGILDSILATGGSYLAVALLLYLPPVAFAGYLLFRLRASTPKSMVPLVVFGSSALGMLFTSWVFGGYVTSLGDDHSSRLLLRYSEFLIPLVWLSLLYLLSKNFEIPKRAWIFGVVPLVSGGIILAAGGLSGLKLQSADSQILFSLSTWVGWFFLFVLSGALIFLSAHSGSYTFKTISAIGFSAALVITSISQIAEQSDYHHREAQEFSPFISKLRDLNASDVIYIGSQRASIASALLQVGNFGSKYSLVNGYSEIPSDWLEDYGFALVQTAIYPPVNSTVLMTFSDTTLYQLRTNYGLDDAYFDRSPILRDIRGAGIFTYWGVWADGNKMEMELSRSLKPGDVMEIDIIRHQLTESSTIVFELGEELIPVDLPAAGRLYSVELTIGQEGYSSFAIGFPESKKIAFVEGMSSYSFGVGGVRIVSD